MRARAVPQSVKDTGKVVSNVSTIFEQFRLGPIVFPAPKELTGSLTTTYLDEEMRISRGDKDNLFVLLLLLPSSSSSSFFFYYYYSLYAYIAPFALFPTLHNSRQLLANPSISSLPPPAGCRIC